MARSSEQWVHPPVVAREHPSNAAAAWRFRLIGLVVLVAFVVVVVLLFLHFSDVTGGEDPGIGASRPAPAAGPAGA